MAVKHNKISNINLKRLINGNSFGKQHTREIIKHRDMGDIIDNRDYTMINDYEDVRVETSMRSILNKQRDKSYINQ
jgi:hypothetical protein